jgi:Glu-tRNA(Gln) amidotransferase subunit E-like FAD-binding protein
MLRVKKETQILFEKKLNLLKTKVPYPYSKIEQMTKNITDGKENILELESEIKTLEGTIQMLIRNNERNNIEIDKLQRIQRERTMRGGGDYEISLAKFEEILRLLKQSHSMLNEDICKKITEMFVSSRFHKEKKQYITELFYNLIESSGDDTLKNKELITNFMSKVKDYL